jgi:hypothetical protein
VAAKTDVSARRAIEWHKITETVLQPYYKLMRAFSSGPCICDCGMMDGAEPGDHGQHFWIVPDRAQISTGLGAKLRSRLVRGHDVDERRPPPVVLLLISWCVGLTVPCVSLEYQSDSQRRSGGGGADAAASEQAAGLRRHRAQISTGLGAKLRSRLVRGHDVDERRPPPILS